MYLYVLAEGPEGPIKIGVTKNILARIKSLQTGNPRPLSVVGKWKMTSTEARRAERCFIDEFSIDEERRLVGEWFDCSTKLVRDCMPDFFQANGLEPRVEGNV